MGWGDSGDEEEKGEDKNEGTKSWVEVWFWTSDQRQTFTSVPQRSLCFSVPALWRWFEETETEMETSLRASSPSSAIPS